MKAPPKRKKDSGIRYDGRKLSARLYLSKKCPHCKKLYEQIKLVRENFRKNGLDLIVDFIDEGKEFYSHDFDSVPTLVVPFQRPFPGISHEWLVDEEKVRKIVLGEVSSEDIKHEIAKERSEHNISRSDKWWKA